MPVIDIKKIDYENLKFSEFKGIIFTSSNAIKCLNVSSIDKNINCFCVGSVTERKARNVGFQNVYSADGNVNNLKELILQNFSQKDGKLLYVSGEIISVSLDKDLISDGYSLQRLVNYSADPIEELNQKFIDELKSSMPDIVYVYSQNSAKNFLKLIKKYQLVDYWMDTNLMCIGEKTSSMLNVLKWKKIFLFNPGEEEFLLYRV
jgi:uroporphyrinogen-III synthase